MAKLVFGIMGPRTEASERVRALAEHLTAGRSGRWERIRALTDFVQHDIVYLNIPTDRDAMAGVRPHMGDEVLRNRYGDCKDKAALLVGLLRAVSEDGRILLVNNGAPQLIDEHWPSLFFNHAIVAIRAGPDAPADWPRLDGGALGALIPFDPTDSMTPLGLLSPGDQGGNTLLVDAGHGGLLRLPQPDRPTDRVERRIESRLAESGVLAVSAEVDLQGLPAAELHGQRVAVRAERMTEFLTRTLDASAPAIRGFSWKEQWDEPKAGYRLNFQFQAAGFSRWLTDDLLAVNPQLFPVGALPAWKTSAEGVAQLQNRVMVDHTRIALPAGYRLEELPPNWDKQGAAVSCHLHYAVKAGVLECDSEFSVRPGFYERERYEAIRLFILKFREAQRRPVLLRPLKPGSPAPAASPPAPA